ncbi:hypothetical protein LguiA_011482 [Lonicera macranthoides]
MILIIDESTAVDFKNHDINIRSTSKSSILPKIPCLSVELLSTISSQNLNHRSFCCIALDTEKPFSSSLNSGIFQAHQIIFTTYWP